MDGHRDLLDQVRSNDEYLLIILDACRYDLFKHLYHFYLDGELKPAYTSARDTFEYVSTMWNRSHDVVYVSGAVPINSVQLQINASGELNKLYDGYRPAEHIEEIVDVWQTGWDDTLGTVPPEAVTEATLERDSEDRLVAHYFQPHAPYIGENRLLGHTGTEHRPNTGKPNDELVWRQVMQGKISDRELRAAYRSNLLRALRSVHRLVEETRHENVYVTADHGEALGEYDTYAHPRDAETHPKIHTVPFLVVE